MITCRLKIRSRGNKQMCLQRTGREIRLRRCSKSRYQRWSELPKNRPFELQMPGNSDKCVSQHHHPKENERIYSELRMPCVSTYKMFVYANRFDLLSQWRVVNLL